jgi:hypothetical protein
MAKRAPIYSKRGIIRWLPWASGLVLVAGAVTFLIVFFGNTADPLPESSPAPNSAQTPAAVEDPVQKTVPLDPKARRVAGQFILTAVARENLHLAWKLSGPDIRQNLTLKEWLTGNIPVQYFPADAIDRAPMKVDESFADSALLEVALLPKAGADIRGQVFFIGLKKVGRGKDARWVVNYFAPRSAPAIPVAPDAGS